MLVRNRALGTYVKDMSTGKTFLRAACGTLLVGALAIVLRYLHKWENRKLEQAERARAENPEGAISDSSADVRADGFRYVY